ncbi:winged helix-turn-helix domain-containing protein [Streptomyces sp. NPDC056069]|uniref:winged helix-turn-helix domain-containing protein n=1 Tax=Streptomyces sp. NPDC056069 TaxID=3345702 RepID=UPI0035E392AD
MRTALEQGAQAHGFEADLWTLERVGLVVERVTGVALSRVSVWRLLTGRLGWSLQRPERRAVERDESEIAHWNRARVAADQKGTVNTRAWIVFLDESGVSLLPQVRRTYAPRGRTPLLRHRLSRECASIGRRPRLPRHRPRSRSTIVLPPQARQLRHRRAYRTICNSVVRPVRTPGLQHRRKWPTSVTSAY